MKQSPLPARASRESPSPAEGRGACAALAPPPCAGEGQASRSDARERGRQIRGRAKSMRSAQTPAEHRLWQILRGKRFDGYKFKRQLPIDHYIADFVCLGQRLIIEADGGQHVESKRDERRDAYLKAQGFRVLRFWNSDVFDNEEGVLKLILDALHSPFPSAASRLPPSPARGRGAGDDHA